MTAPDAKFACISLHACEVREIATWPRERRVEHYRAVEKHRGKDAAQKLANDVTALLRARPAA